MVTYELNDKITANANITIDTEEKLQIAIGCDYTISKDKKLSVNFVENL